MVSSALLPTLLAAQSSGGGSGGSSIAGLLPIVLLFGVMWFVMIRPQQRKAREQRALVTGVKQGDRVVAAGGIVGTVRRVDDDTLSLQVADNVVLKVDKSTVARKLAN